MNGKDIKCIFKKIDQDNSNSIDFNEFVQALHSYLFFNPTKTKLLDDFERYDKGN
jgi:Ca2+-binding EF-hand superfamily protein